ncbi:hypothetical protein GGR06_003086 [Bacteroides reticulotermitis]|uniref:Transposase IS66 central domain-containing protein n=2 Tax=Bacteroides reticulotermitis TaxID=1133319 RepID=A0A840D724_9BACE|nr:hypothetical protein [Bacteroides reticulotermitis]
MMNRVPNTLSNKSSSFTMWKGKTDDTNLSHEARAELRSRLAYPTLVRFEKWLIAEYPKVVKTSPIGKAIKYVYQRFDKLSRYHLDGRYRPDNNLAGNSIRPIAEDAATICSVATMTLRKTPLLSTRLWVAVKPLE